MTKKELANELDKNMRELLFNLKEELSSDPELSSKLSKKLGLLNKHVTFKDLEQALFVCGETELADDVSSLSLGQELMCGEDQLFKEIGFPSEYSYIKSFVPSSVIC